MMLSRPLDAKRKTPFVVVIAVVVAVDVVVVVRILHLEDSLWFFHHLMIYHDVN